MKDEILALATEVSNKVKGNTGQEIAAACVAGIQSENLSQFAGAGQRAGSVADAVYHSDAALSYAMSAIFFLAGAYQCVWTEKQINSVEDKKFYLQRAEKQIGQAKSYLKKVSATHD